MFLKSVCFAAVGKSALQMSGRFDSDAESFISLLILCLLVLPPNLKVYFCPCGSAVSPCCVYMDIFGNFFL